MKEKCFTWGLFVSFIILTVFIFIISFKIDLYYEGKIKMIEMILGSISVSIGFFGTIFTFIFGLKDNNIFKKIMGKENSRLQFKLLNSSIIFLGFGIIIFCIITIALLYNQNSGMSRFLDILIRSIFSLLILYYLFFCTYLYIITKLVFDSKHKLTIAKSPKIKSGVAKEKIRKREE